jgi:phosphohistidine phosphatase
MVVYLMRHGIAEDHPVKGQGDFDRALTDEGKTKVRHIARHLRKLGVMLDVVHSSPLLRARQTAEIVAEELARSREVVLLKQLDTSTSPIVLFNTLISIQSGRDVFLVGHEPTMGVLASMILSGSTNVRIPFKRAAVAALDAEIDEHRIKASMKWFISYGIIDQ